ncbi:hypothetical protein [Celerinatantimonas yamalensis]|uniref:Uncharacterized protein n=1 Tax=Celerinatantimonas yamalensis TaxID=559956 RepID=A0ABW9G9W4_9GAMM
MTIDELQTLLKLTTEQTQELRAIEARYIELTEQVFGDDLSARKMLKSLRQLSQNKHQQICALLTQKQQQHYLHLIADDHQMFKHKLLQIK